MEGLPLQGGYRMFDYGIDSFYPNSAAIDDTAAEKTIIDENTPQDFENEGNVSQKNNLNSNYLGIIIVIIGVLAFLHSGGKI